STVQAQFPEPYPMFVDVLSAFTQVGSGHALGGTNFGGFTGGFAPAHYLKQFHAKYASKEQLDQRVKEAKVDNWILLLKLKNNYQLNPECPVVTPWRTVSPINTQNWVLERNPFFWCVDTDGNQLPYIDKVSLTLAENLEVANLRAIAGEYDLQTRHLDVRSEEHTSELQSRVDLVCRLLLEKKKNKLKNTTLTKRHIRMTKQYIT